MSHSSSLLFDTTLRRGLAPPRLENKGEFRLKVTEMFVAFLRERNCTFWMLNIFNHRGIAYGCA